MAFDDELAELMVRAGAVGMEIGSDSGCDEILDRLRKGFRTDKITRLSRISRISKAHGLKDCHSFILGTRFNPRSFTVLRKHGMRGPLWQHLDRLAVG